MKSVETIINDYIEAGKITESQGDEIMEKCAALGTEAFSKFFKKLLGRSKPVIKETIKKTTTQAPKAAEAVSKEIPNKIGRFSKFKAALKSPEVKNTLIASGITTAAAGTMGLGAAMGQKISIAKQSARNYNNLIQSNPNLIKEEDKLKAKKLVTELTKLSPLAATNDQVLKNYVMKGLKKGIELKDMSQAANMRQHENQFFRMISHPPMPAQLVGQIGAKMGNVTAPERVLRAYDPSEMEDAVNIKAVMDAYSLQPEMGKMFRDKMSTDPESVEKLYRATRGAVSREDWANIRDQFIKTGSVDLEKTANFWESFKKSLPYMAGLAAIGTGVGATHAGVEAVRTVKERNLMEKTFDTIKKNPDFKGKEKELKMAFNTLAKFAPALATQPQTALAFIRSSVIDYPDPVTGEPMIDPSQIKNLADLQKTYEQRESRSPFVTSFGKGFKRGFEGTGGAIKTIGTLARAGENL